jgi:hypothetical protein
MTNGWNSERRVRQAEAIRRWRPWEHSTGPRTPHGKARSARNADRGGQRRRWREMSKALNAAMREQRRISDTAQSRTPTVRPRVVRTFGPVRPIRPQMVQPSNERRCHLYLVPPSPCPVCKSPRATRVGVVDDVGYFRCADCDGVFTIRLTSRVGETADVAHKEN